MARVRQEKAGTICVYYNRPGGCNKRKCDFENRCWRCFKPGHGAYNIVG